MEERREPKTVEPVQNHVFDVVNKTIAQINAGKHPSLKAAIKDDQRFQELVAKTSDKKNQPYISPSEVRWLLTKIHDTSTENLGQQALDQLLTIVENMPQLNEQLQSNSRFQRIKEIGVQHPRWHRDLIWLSRIVFTVDKRNTQNAATSTSNLLEDQPRKEATQQVQQPMPTNNLLPQQP